MVSVGFVNKYGVLHGLAFPLKPTGFFIIPNKNVKA